jgi:hypothetical protein
MKTFIAIAAVLMAAALMAIVSTTPLAAYADRDYDMKDDDRYGKDRDGKDSKKFYPGDTSETNTEQNLKQKNVGSGDSTNINCGTNNIDTTASALVCPEVEILGGLNG